jgi:rhamnosyltransferase subunit B
MKLVLVPVGSAGDVFPFVGLGMGLQRRGHEVLVITNSYFEATIRKAGLDFEPFGTVEEYRAAIAHPDLWHPIRGFQTIASFLLQQQGLYERIAALCRDRRAMVVGHSLAIAARVAQDRWEIPVVTVHPAPALLRSEFQPPTMTGLINLGPLPRRVKRMTWWLLDRLMIDPLLEEPVNGLRRWAGLPPVRRMLHDWIHSPLMTIGMFPEWFAPPQPDWPPQVRLSGFPLFDLPDQEPVPEELERMLEAGPPPLVFTPGTAMVQGRRFFEAAVEACVRLERPGVLLTRFEEQVPQPLPANMRHFAYAPLSMILPRCAALVHHGGIGTTAAALAGGVPQVNMPMAHDQPDNAARIQSLGVGARVLPRRFTASRLVRALEGLLNNPQVQQRCLEFAQRCREERGLERTCDLIEHAASEAGIAVEQRPASV